MGLPRRRPSLVPLPLDQIFGLPQIVERSRIIRLQLNSGAEFCDCIRQSTGLGEHDTETGARASERRRKTDATAEGGLRLVELSGRRECVGLVEDVSHRARIHRDCGRKRLQGTGGLIHLHEHDTEVGEVV